MPGVVIDSCDSRPYGPEQSDWEYEKWRNERDEAMSVIWKFQLEMTSKQAVEMPKGARIIFVASQFEKPCLWAIVNPTEEKEKRQIGIITTGQQHFNAYEVKYIGSFILQGGAFVGHVVEPMEAGNGREDDRH